ncbi:uncharacterized protein HMPREF1541_08258 [Cyphellophora europaea CBS 101466]|uniref:HTH araC/xylS-type domain-containing protein n=1 Tax=Cyphellophora europaea (strain CBS 101466) TaxID=1220924 RepID=W2RLB1_CYPE1|nr:uncharacterized protein HMPREF1541_08258 [Cyphellophora europaea CBS 101466]ETN37267.1 hypothetical protein HMPREF1541_08258 [Cyphellophora europaea CBS 101466]
MATANTPQPIRPLLPSSSSSSIPPTAPHQPQPPSTSITLTNPSLAKTDSARWSILSSRACPRSATPPFIYAVTTTHIFCRPTCPARLARRANIVFFDTAGDAARAGFRACKRCRPDVVPVTTGRSADDTSGGDGSGGDDADDVVPVGDGEEGRRKVQQAVRVIRERAARGRRIGLRELSEEVGLSRWHLLRVFRKRWGVTPKEMGEALQAAGGGTRARANPSPDEARDGNHSTPSALAGTVAGDAETISDASNVTPATPAVDLQGHDAFTMEGRPQPGALFDDAFLDFDFAALDHVDLTAPELWTTTGEDGEGLLMDLFPEVYQYDAKTQSSVL